MKIKYVSDYVDEIHKKFPEIDKKEISYVMNYGFKMYYGYNNMGLDVLLTEKRHTKLWMLTGKLFTRYDLYKKYSSIKYALKFRWLDRKKKEDWDGYYYFGLSEDLFRFFESQEDEEEKIFENIFLYKLLEEAKLQTHLKYFFKVKYPKFRGYKFYLENYTTKDVILLDKMKDNETNN